MLHRFRGIQLHSRHGLAGPLALVLALVSAPSWAQSTPDQTEVPALPDSYMPAGLADQPIDVREQYMREHLLEPAEHAIERQRKIADARAPTDDALLAHAPTERPKPIPGDTLVIEVFVDAAFTDRTLADLCALKTVDARVRVPVEHRNYVVMRSQSVAPQISSSGECLKDWPAVADFGGQIMRSRGVSSLPYFAAHFGGTTVQSALGDYDYELRRLITQYELRDRSTSP